MSAQKYLSTLLFTIAIIALLAAAVVQFFFLENPKIIVSVFVFSAVLMGLATHVSGVYKRNMQQLAISIYERGLPASGMLMNVEYLGSTEYNPQQCWIKMTVLVQPEVSTDAPFESRLEQMVDDRHHNDFVPGKTVPVKYDADTRQALVVAKNVYVDLR